MKKHSLYVLLELILHINNWNESARTLQPAFEEAARSVDDAMMLHAVMLIQIDTV